MTRWQQEFPDFPAADMPPIPAGWEDVSWKMETCPTFQRGNLVLCIDYADPAKRPTPEFPRFIVGALTEDGMYSHAVIESDNWGEVLADLIDSGNVG